MFGFTIGAFVSALTDYEAGRGAAYAANQDWQKARKDLDIAVKYDSKNYEKYEARSMVLYELKEKEAAYNDINKAIELAPNEPTPYRLRALFKLGDKQFRAAKADFSLGKKIEKAKKKAQKKAEKEARKKAKESAKKAVKKA